LSADDTFDVAESPDGDRMRRREFITFLGGAATGVLWPLDARAQQPARVARIGYLGFGTAATFASRVEALRAGLRDLGYVEGKNIFIDFRWAEGWTGCASLQPNWSAQKST
jgi:hypothetical protein